MNVHAVLGLALLNLLFLCAGASLVWGIRGWSTWQHGIRLGGLSYLLGVAVVCVACTELLVIGVPVGIPALLILVAALCALGLGLGGLTGRASPRLAAPAPLRLDLGAVVTLVSSLVAVFLVGALFQEAVSLGTGSFEWDAWAFWIPKAESIYFSGHLDPKLFASVAAPSYPILVPTLEQLGFHFMGSVDTVTIHLQFWFLFVGFLLALVGLLRPRVPLWLIAPFLALLAAMPELQLRVLTPEADWTLDFFVALATLALALWLLDREPYMLALSGAFLCAAMSTKREGQLLTAAVVVSGMLVTYRSWRAAWPRIVGVGAVAFVFTLPWRIWWTSNGLPDESNLSLGGLGHNLGRTWPSFKLVLNLLFDPDRWLIVVPIALAAALLVALQRQSAGIAAFFTASVVLTVAGYVWILWTLPDLELSTTSSATPIPRAVVSIVLTAAAFAPLLLSFVLPKEAGAWTLPGRLPRVRVAPLVAAGCVVYLAAFVVPYSIRAAGPRSCGTLLAPPSSMKPGLRLVLVTTRTEPDAVSAEALATERGFQRLQLAQLGCHTFGVVLYGIPSKKVGLQIEQEARSAGFRSAALQG